MEQVSEPTRRALTIVRDHPGISCRRFGELMWPDAPGHEKPSNIGYGATRGVGMWRAAGGFLGKLRKRGLVRDGAPYGDRHYCPLPQYFITEAGREALDS